MNGLIATNQLNTALLTIHEDEKGYFCSGQFVDLWTHVHINVILGKIPKKFQDLNNYLKFIHQDIWNIETIALRLKWQKDLWNRGELNDSLWMSFAASDIDLFHVEFRSIFDYLAKIISLISDSPGQSRGKSFEKLKGWLAKSSNNSKKLGEDLAQLVRSCAWFDELRRVRDSIIHKGGFTLVFPEKDKILFQLINGKILGPEIMFNENVVNFELYAGLYIGYLIAYLEEVSQLVYKRLNLQRIGSNAQSYHPGLQVVRDWIKQVLERVG